MSGLDPVSRIKMRKLIFKLNEEGKSVFYTSHDLAEVEKLAHRVMLMIKGEIVMDNLKSDILSNYRNLEELFLEKVGVHIDEENNEI